MRKLLLLPLLFVAGLFITEMTSVYAATYTEGVNYTRVEQQPTETGKKIEVLEFFWYGCPHCFHFEPFLDKWEKTMPKNVAFVRIPAIFRPDWKIQARAYYALLNMGVIEKIHDKIFNAIHKDRKPLHTLEELANFVAKNGVNREQFIKEYNSFTVDNMVRKGLKKMQAYHIEGVPAVIVNGKYKVSPRKAGSFENMIKIINYLVKKESTSAGAGTK